jgi:hypothetical protein
MGTWVGIGYSNHEGMDNLDINAVEFSQHGYTLYDMWSVTILRPQLDTEISGTNDVKCIKYETSGESATLYFERKLDTGDLFDKVLNVVSFMMTLFRELMMFI